MLQVKIYFIEMCQILYEYSEWGKLTDAIMMQFFSSQTHFKVKIVVEIKLNGKKGITFLIRMKEQGK